MVHFRQVVESWREKAVTVRASRLGRRNMARNFRWSVGSRSTREHVCTSLSAAIRQEREGPATHLADALEDSEAVSKVSNVEDRYDQFDVRIVSHALCEREPTGLALASLVARSKSLVEHTMQDGRAILDLVQISLVRLEL